MLHTGTVGEAESRGERGRGTWKGYDGGGGYWNNSLKEGSGWSTIKLTRSSRQGDIEDGVRIGGSQEVSKGTYEEIPKERSRIWQRGDRPCEVLPA